MKEYTFLSLAGVLGVIIADRTMRTFIFKKSEFHIFIFCIFCVKLLVNGYLTSQNIVMYNEKYFLGLRLGSIPIEDFLFGFSMVSLSIILWEFFKKSIPCHEV